MSWALLWTAPSAGQTVDYTTRSREIMDNYDTGDQSIPFASYPLEPGIGDQRTECDEDNWPKDNAKFKYHCNATMLASDAAGGRHKFRAMVCRFGDTPERARFRAYHESDRMVDAAKLQYQKANDGSAMRRDRESIRCKIGVLDASPATDQAAAQPPTTLSYAVESTDRYPVRMKLFSQKRDWYWPSKTTSWTVAPRTEEKGTISCQPSEKICVGVWRTDQDASWGVGRDNDTSCTNCCATCGGQINVKVSDVGEKPPTPARFLIHNNDRYTLSLQFYNETNRGRAWPGGDQHYVLNGTRLYKLNCDAGVKICFGAWRDNQTIYWGAGRNNGSCENCCTTCGGEFETTLNDGGSDSFPSSGGGGSAGSWIGAAANILGAVAGAAGGFRSSGGGGARPSGGGAHYGPGPGRPESGISGGH